MLRYKGFTYSASEENGEIANAIWLLSLIPYLKCPWQEICGTTHYPWLAVTRMTQAEEEHRRYSWINSYSNYKPQC